MIKEMLNDLKLTLNITVAKDGQAALDILKNIRNGKPGLVILDLNLPKVNGFEVLTYIKSSQTLRSIPVVVMTGSLRGEDEQRSRELAASTIASSHPPPMRSAVGDLPQGPSRTVVEREGKDKDFGPSVRSIFTIQCRMESKGLPHRNTTISSWMLSRERTLDAMEERSLPISAQPQTLRSFQAPSFI